MANAPAVALFQSENALIRRLMEESKWRTEQDGPPKVALSDVQDFIRWMGSRGYVSQQWADATALPLEEAIARGYVESLVRDQSFPASGRLNFQQVHVDARVLARIVLITAIASQPASFQQFQREIDAYNRYMETERRHQDILTRLDRIGSSVSESVESVAAALTNPSETVVHLSPEALEALRQPIGSGTKQILFDRNAAGQVVAATAIDG